MTVTVDLPAEAIRRLEAEASRRGVTIDDVITDLAIGLPADDPLEAFIGCGASGYTEPFDIDRAREDMAAERDHDA